ncbi:hypothetical protein Ddye_000835 [Dipteronia dyeriana]|uniref:RNase H type-1 domain-containing protein n=1 Tax=Dipteronia dyeriana TaxID=168575 RepID=A0AAE0CSY1_9ROSI|nr:hypothetical protein Ddye_000835 [Dipteronia dyeriana]
MNHGCRFDVDLTLLISNLNDRCVDISVAKVKRASVESPLPVFDLSFNVDGSATGSPGKARIGGVDSKSVVGWIKGLDFSNLQLVHLVYDIRQFLKSSAGFDIKYMPRELNSFADNLAKAASSDGRDRLEWGDV